MAYIGNTVQTQGFTPAIDYFNGNGVTVTFTLSRPIASVAQVIVAIDNVIQNPSSAFNVVGNSITFTSAPLAGTNNIWVEYTSLITTYQGISQDPTVIGDIRATGGYLAEGDFGNSFVDGTILDYVTGAGRVTVGELDDLVFYHGGTAGRSEMMRLSYAGTNSYVVGNFGVGTTNPTSKLDVSGEIKTLNGTAALGVIIKRTDGVNANGAVNFVGSDDAVDASVRMATDVANALVFTAGGATERMRIDSSGNLLVGRTTPLAGGEKLSVQQSGNAVAICASSNAGPNIGNYESSDFGRNAWWTFGRDNTITGNFIFAYNGSARSNINLTTGAYTAVSDARLKKNVTDLNYGLNEVLAMRPVSYLMEQEEDTAKKHLGFIAQEVKAVMDEAVDDLIDEDTQFYGLDKSGLVPVLVKAIQEQQAIIEDLKARIETLEAK